MATELAKTTYNRNILVLYSKVNRYIEELHKSNSANASAMDEHDVKRVMIYLNDLRAYMAYVKAQPHPDLVEVHPRVRELVEPYILVPIENEACMEVCWLLEEFRDEMSNSQSSREHSGLLFFDMDRGVSLLDKLEKFIEDYAQDLLPIDRPRSSPYLNVLLVPLNPSLSTQVITQTCLQRL